MAQTWTPRRIRSEEERNSGNSDFISLKKEENFLGIPLFDGDPAADEPGYYEYYEHWDNEAKRRVPCPGEEVCPLCQEGERPSTRAKSVWLVYSSKIKGSTQTYDPPKVMVFSLNWNLIKILTEMRTEGDKIKGRQFRVSCLDDRGNYSLMGKDEKITATAVKEALKDGPELEKMVTQQLRKAMQAYSLREAMDDTDHDDEVEQAASSKTSKSKAKAKPKDEPVEWPDEAEEITVKVEGLDGNTISVSSGDYEDETTIWGTDGKDGVDFTDLEPGAVIVVSYETDDDGDKVASSFESAEAEESTESGDVNLPAKFVDEVLEVAGAVDPKEGTIPVTSEEYGDFTVFVLEGVDFDWDDLEPGVKIKVSGALDTSDDMVLADAPEVVKATAGKRKTAASTGRKKSA